MLQNAETAQAATRPIPPSIVRGRLAVPRGAEGEVEGEEDEVDEVGPPFNLAFKSRFVLTSRRARVTVIVYALVTVTQTGWNGRTEVDGYKLGYKLV